MPRTELEVLADRFRALADIDFRGASPLYERLSREAADDSDVLSLLLGAGRRDRRPHLLFAAVKYLLWREGSDPLAEFEAEPFSEFRSWCLAHRCEIEDLVATHVIQTNEVARCAAVLPCLAVVAESAQQPLAIVEVGASAGLNLLFDRYRYVYGTGLEAGTADSDVVLRPRLRGDLVPRATIPPVSWRRGLDRLPVDVTDTDLLVELARDRPLWWVSGEAAGLVGQLGKPTPTNEQIAFVYGVVPLGISGHGPRTLARAGGPGTWLEWLEPQSAQPRT